MTSTPTQLNRLEKQGQGDHVDTWGTQHLNPTLDLIDHALDGQVVIDTSSAANPYTLTVNDYTADEARQRVVVLKGSGTNFRFNVKFGLPHWYWVSNQSGAAVTAGFDNDAATTVIPPGVWLLLVKEGSSLVVSQPGLDIDPVVVVTGPAFSIESIHANKAVVCLNDCAVTVGSFANAPAGAWVLVRSVYSAVTVSLADPWKGAVTASLPFQNFVRVAAVGGGQATLLEWGKEVTF